MEIDEGFYWCETADTNAIFKTKSETFESLKEMVDDTDDVEVWYLEKISSENFHWAEVSWEELMDEALTD